MNEGKGPRATGSTEVNALSEQISTSNGARGINLRLPRAERDTPTAHLAAVTVKSLREKGNVSELLIEHHLLLVTVHTVYRVKRGSNNAAVSPTEWSRCPFHLTYTRASNKRNKVFPSHTVQRCYAQKAVTVGAFRVAAK